MIYFLVNNNYHLIDVYEHCKVLKEYKKSLIQVPHTLDVINEDETFSSILTYQTPFKGIRNFFNIYKVKRKEEEIKKSLNITKDDILFVYTEYEILNQYIIMLFKNANAKVYIMNEGLATYLTYNVKCEKGLPLKQKIKLFYTKYILGYNFVEYLYYNNLVFPQINEKYIDGVFLYLDVNILRNIKKYVIKKHVMKLKLNPKYAIFLNETMYMEYCSKEEYRYILEDILSKMTIHFEKIYFKFHPRETEENKQWQLHIINKFDNLYVIKDNMPIENLLEEYDSKYIFSFLSAALLNVNAMGATPVYIYHLYEAISKNNVFKVVNNILCSAEYKFINEKFNNIKSIGFKINVKDSSKNFIDFITEEGYYED